MTSIDERLTTSADAIRRGFGDHEGPGVRGVARASRRRRQRKAGAAVAIIVCLGLVAVLTRPSGNGEVDVAAQNPEARAEAVDTCRASFEAFASGSGDSVLATEGVDLRSIDPVGMDVASVVSADGETSSVALSDPAIAYRCLGDPGGSQSSWTFGAAAGPVPPNELWIDDLVAFGSEPLLLAGSVGADVVAIEAELADLGPTEFWIEDGRFLMIAPPYEEADVVPLGELVLTWTLTDGTTRSDNALAALGRSTAPVDDEDGRTIAIDRCETELLRRVEGASATSPIGRLNLSPNGPSDQWFQVRTFDDSPFGRLVPVVFEHPEAFAYCLATEGALLEFDLVTASPLFLPEDQTSTDVFVAHFGIETDTTPPADVPLIVGRVGFDVEFVELVADVERFAFDSYLSGATDERWFVITGGLEAGATVEDAELVFTLVDGRTTRVSLADALQPRG